MNRPAVAPTGPARRSTSPTPPRLRCGANAPTRRRPAATRPPSKPSMAPLKSLVPALALLAAVAAAHAAVVEVKQCQWAGAFCDLSSGAPRRGPARPAADPRLPFSLNAAPPPDHPAALPPLNKPPEPTPTLAAYVLKHIGDFNASGDATTTAILKAAAKDAACAARATVDDCIAAPPEAGCEWFDAEVRAPTRALRYAARAAGLCVFFGSEIAGRVRRCLRSSSRAATAGLARSDGRPDAPKNVPQTGRSRADPPPRPADPPQLRRPGRGRPRNRRRPHLPRHAGAAAVQLRAGGWRCRPFRGPPWPSCQGGFWGLGGRPARTRAAAARPAVREEHQHSARRLAAARAPCARLHPCPPAPSRPRRPPPAPQNPRSSAGTGVRRPLTAFGTRRTRPAAPRSFRP